MLDIVRDAPFGQCLRLLGLVSAAKYKEEDELFVPPRFDRFEQSTTSSERHAVCDRSHENMEAINSDPNSRSSPDTRQYRVGWYDDEDPENPHNWSSGKKAYISALLFIYSFSVYIGSSLYTASVPGIVSRFGVGDIAASVGLAMFVLGYGIGPMLFSPLSEIPSLGRNNLYIITYAMFVVLCVPMALVENYPGILVLRFLLGFFGSPCLATVPASYGDFSTPSQMPYVMALWGGGATLGPCFGPLVGGFAVQAMGWRWSSWELLWLCAPICILMFFSLPETSSDNILLRRAGRLRVRTGRDDIQSESEVRQAHMAPREILFNALVKPWQINALDPAVLFTTFYTGLTYGVYYSFFESFPLVYQDLYGFTLGELGLCYLSTFVGLSVAVALLCAYLRFLAPTHLAKYDSVPPEARIWPGLFATFMIPIGLFLFAFTARKSVPWFASLFGVAISMCGTFIVTQSMFIYLPFTYPRFSGSLFAANGLSRSLFAVSAILFSLPLFQGIGIDGGVSLLAGVSVLCVFGMFGIYCFGASLRKRSNFSGD